MVIGILYSEPGCGKSYQALGFEEPILCFDMENRLQKKIDKYYPDKLITLVELKLFDKSYNEDKVGSFDGFNKEIKKLIALRGSDIPQTVIIDGIGDLRDYAHEKWCKVENRKRAKSPGDWEGVNDLVREALFPPINWARANNTNLVMTAQMKDNYSIIGKGEEKTSAKDGRVPSFKEFCSYNVDFLIELSQPKIKGKVQIGKYFATCVKSEVGSWEEDITGKSLFEVLQSKGVV